MSEYRTARIFVRDKLAGFLRETDEGYSFAYDTDYLSSDNPSPVSLTLPLTDNTYTSNTLHAQGWILQNCLFALCFLISSAIPICT